MGTIVVGKLESGHIRKGEMLLLMLNRDEVEVVAMYNELEEEVNVARLWRQRAHPSAWC
jgi:peptide chain release factor subunit 3